MIQVIATLLTLAIAALSLGISWAMITQNQTAILSALAGRGAFPNMISPDTSPAALAPFNPRSKMRHARRNSPARAPQHWSHAA